MREFQSTSFPSSVPHSARARVLRMEYVLREAPREWEKAENIEKEFLKFDTRKRAPYLISVLIFFIRVLTEIFFLFNKITGREWETRKKKKKKMKWKWKKTKQMRTPRAWQLLPFNPEYFNSFTLIIARRRMVLRNNESVSTKMVSEILHGVETSAKLNSSGWVNRTDIFRQICRIV